MTDTDIFLLALLLPAALGAALTVIPGHTRTISRISLALCAVSCIVGATTFFAVDMLPLVGFTATFGPLVGCYSVSFDGFTGLVVSLSSIVYLLTVIHQATMPEKFDKTNIGLICILFGSCIVAMVADSVVLLLIGWEMVSLVTFLMTKGADEMYRWRYFVITHFGGLFIMAVFAALWYTSGTCVLSELPVVGTGMSSAVSAAMVFLLYIGFGTKLGIIPFHAWMPDLYSSAPVHSVTLLSTVCSNVAILLLVKSTFLWIGVPDGALVPTAILALAALGSIWGAMESLIQTQPRRILAYSSMENMSMVLVCLALAMLFQNEFDKALTALILCAGVLHTLNHSFFKALMLLNVGSMERLTGKSDIKDLGGLALYLPALSLFALIGTLSMAAIPPTNGFVSEWLMIKSVVSAGTGTSALNVMLPLVVAALGMCGTMAAVSYARLYGFVFLGRPRSENVPKAEKMKKSMAAPLAALSVACLAMGVFSVQLVDVINEHLQSDLGLDGVSRTLMTDALDPAMIAVILVGTGLVVYALFRLFRKERRTVTTWDCGTPLNKDMQYSSEGFSQPLVRVFHPFYGDSSEIKDTVGGTDTYRIRFVEPFMKYVLVPIGRGVRMFSLQVDRIQNGNIQSYLAYMLITLLVILMGVRILC
ncbi:MAG: hypothetical protein MJZ68_04075 [archaeon]|nr:hypothetical protein [archaeon]